MIDENKFTFQEGVSPLRQIRDALGLTQAQFGQLIGVSGQTISNWETGARDNPVFTVRQMKNLQQAIKPLKMDIPDLPDVLGPPPPAQPD